MKKKFKTFEEFYDYYLGQHSEWRCRLSHFIGTSLAVPLIIVGAYNFIGGLLTLDLEAVIRSGWWFGAAIVTGYGPAILSHPLFQGNTALSFTNPWWAFRSDWKMWWEILAGKISIWPPPAVGDF
ncbi:MAG: DUF962 domain-containing protein [Minisyncoccia bacterium]